MDRDQEGKGCVPEAEIREAVTDFAQLALRMDVPEASSASKPATLLLERLLLLCQARQGVLFLTGEEPQAVVAPSNRKASRIIALQEIGEEQAYRLLFSFLPITLSTVGVNSVPGTPGWALCHVPTSVSSPVGDQALSQISAQPLLFGDVWFLFGWPGETDGACDALLERARLLLQQVVVPVGAALLSLLQRERIQELEAIAYTESVREMELLKAELLATISHELRSPLASIKGYTATLLRHERRISAQERHEFLLAIQQGSDRLQFIVERFLHMSQLETESVKVSPHLIDLARLLQEAIGAAQARVLRQEPASFTFRMHVQDADGRPADRAPLVRADPRLLREVLDHLLENAVSYSPEGGVIEVILRPVPASSLPGERLDQTGAAESAPLGKEGIAQADHLGTERQRAAEMVEIRVRDRGMGIASEHLDRIFERFYRVDTALTRSVGGLGLGLAISRKIIELHGGSIWAESWPGGGSAFCVHLPISQEETDPESAEW